MSQARGIDTIIGLYDESTYGVDPGAPDAQKLYVKNFKVASKQNLIDSETLNGQRSRSRPTAGNIDLDGDFEVELAAESMGTLLKHTLGSNVTTGAGPYTHTIKIGNLPVGMVLEKDHGSTISGAGRYEKFNGSRIAKASFDFQNEGYINAAFSVKGRSSTLGSAPLDATYTDNGHTPFSIFEGVLQEGGGTSAIVKAAKIDLDNDLDDSLYAIGGAGLRRALPEGFATISGEITALFEDAVLLNKAINGTQSSLKVTLSRGTGLGSAGNEFMEFTVTNLLYERSSPPIEGPKGILVTLGLKGFRVTTDNGFQIVIKNAVATI